MAKRRNRPTTSAVRNANTPASIAQVGKDLGITDEVELSGLVTHVRDTATPVVEEHKTKKGQKKAREKLSPAPTTPASTTREMSTEERVNTPLIGRIQRGDIEAGAWEKAQNEQRVNDNRPLSPRTITQLENLGIRGLRTHGEALTHLHATAALFGLPIGGTKKITSEGTITNEATRVLANSGEQGANLSGLEAEIIDKALTLHTGLSTMLKPFKHAKNDEKSEEPDVRKGRDPKKRPQIERQSLDTPESDEEKRITAQKRDTRKSEPVVTSKPKLAGKTITYLPPIPKPNTEGLEPSKAKYQEQKYNKAMRERLAVIDQMSAEGRARANRPLAAPEPTPSVEPSPPAPRVESFDPYAAAGNMANSIAQYSAEALRSNLRNEWRGNMGYKEEMFTRGGYSYPEPKQMLSEMGRTPNLTPSRNAHFAMGHSKGPDQPLNMWEWMMPKDD